MPSSIAKVSHLIQCLLNHKLLNKNYPWYASYLPYQLSSYPKPQTIIVQSGGTGSYNDF